MILPVLGAVVYFGWSSANTPEFASHIMINERSLLHR